MKTFNNIKKASICVIVTIIETICFHFYFFVLLTFVHVSLSMRNVTSKLFCVCKQKFNIMVTLMLALCDLNMS